MGFSDLASDAGLMLLDKWVKTRSYICGFSPSQADVICFKAVDGPPAVERYPNAFRWYNHIKSYEPEFSVLPGDPSKAYTVYGPESATVVSNLSDAPNTEEAEDDIDLFGSDEDEEEDPEVVAEREKRLAEYRQKKAGKAKSAAKSIVTLDVKPYGDDTDMNELKSIVLQIEMDGLIWGNSKFVPIGYGIRKLQLDLVVEDEKVSIDELETRIVDGLPDFVQSMDVVMMQKL